MSIGGREAAPAAQPLVGRQSVTACLIVRDEQHRLPQALDSVAFCDEVVVVDSGSKDRTVELARATGATVLENPWPGFGAQRNFALDHAHGDWVLEVDADERVSEALRDEILRFLAMPPPADVRCCALPLRDRFLGGLLGPSAKYPRYRIRFFRRDSYRHDERRRVHEGLWPRERVWAMRGDLEHELAASWREALGDLWAYARLESGHVAALPSATHYVKAIVARPAVKFAYRLVVDGGWRDGWRGLVRISLDCAGDALVWARRSIGRVPERLYDEDADGHFGRLVLRTGPIRLVAVAGGDAARDRALSWLRAARAAGADVALVTDSPVDGGDWLHVEAIPRIGPLHVVRAMDAVAQMRPIDRVLLDCSMPGAALALLSPAARGATAPGSLDEDPAATVQALQLQTRT